MSQYTKTSVNLDYVVDQMQQAVSQADTDVNAKLAELGKANSGTDGADKSGGKLNPADLANVQHALNQWSISYNLAASTNRTVKDLLSGIIQKI